MTVELYAIQDPPGRVHQVWVRTPQTQVRQMTFPGGEPHVKIDNLFDHNVVAYVIDARVRTFLDIGAVLVLNDALRRTTDLPIHLFTPYLPGARQDRGVPFTAKVYADLINTAGFDSVIALDPHSDVMPALLDRFIPVPAEEIFPVSLFPGPTEAVLVCPDAGAVKRTEAVATKHGYEVIYARKHRDFKTGKLTGFSCDPLPDNKTKAIIVDDICDGGGTFLGLAPEIRWAGGVRNHPNLYLWVTHGIFSQGLTKLRETFALVGSTDSFPSPELGSVPALALARAIAERYLNKTQGGLR